MDLGSKETKYLLARFVPSKFMKWYKLTLTKTADEDFLFSCDFQLFPALFQKYKRFILVIHITDWIIITIYCWAFNQASPAKSWGLLICTSELISPF